MLPDQPQVQASAVVNDVVTASEFATLMAEASRGSEDAAWRITEVYTPHIMRAVRATLPTAIRPKADSQDYAQAVWASVFLSGRDFKQFTSPQQFIAYLAAAARHKIIDDYRHFTKTQAYNVRVEVPLESDDGPQGRGRSLQRRGPLVKSREPPASQVARMRERWHVILDSCSERDRKIVSLRRAGHGLDEIATRLNINERTVRRALNRLLDGLKP